ncbi:chloride channel protein [Zooshikella marina]|uniref:chloride channel protein n=1 Tax=Zooshikella ganghwensis TaxID=202772 RepID=UPI001BAF8900|nr:chloride channel protein [Zooshikella ganghwensis]MBU2708052.1 chloride channel protein [Zooshikella ganghwensis]
MLKDRFRLPTLERFRHQVADVNALPQLAILGFFSGLFSGMVVILFRHAVELPLQHILPNFDDENFEGLTLVERIGLPLFVGMLILITLYRVKPKYLRVGITHVIERLSYHQGHLPIKNMLVQFFGGSLAIISGQPVGREGPAVHLGAACSSLLGQWLKLPNNSIRTLVGCGAAGAISAAFNTPIAGVIFAMEVIMMEYTIAGFTPVILAAVTAAVLSEMVYGMAPAFSVPPMFLASLWELPLVVIVGILAGILAACFTHLVQLSCKLRTRPLWQRIILASLLTAISGAILPEIMGVGYDTVNMTLSGIIPLQLLCFLVIGKLLVSGTICGLGLPGGLIGPVLFIGASLGGALGIAGAYLTDSSGSPSGFYAMLGMGAMMGAVLQAPLAALMAVLELTQNPHIILPAMLVIVVASMTSKYFFKKPSVFLTQLQAQGLNFRNDPLSQALQRTGVSSIMERQFVRLARHCTYEEASQALTTNPIWIVIDTNKPEAILLAADLARYLGQTQEEANDESESDTIDLLALPGERKDITPLYIQATLHEALEKLDQTQVEALYITSVRAPMINRINGIITRKAIERFYQFKH